MVFTLFHDCKLTMPLLVIISAASAIITGLSHAARITYEPGVTVCLTKTKIAQLLLFAKELSPGGDF